MTSTRHRPRLSKLRASLTAQPDSQIELSETVSKSVPPAAPLLPLAVREVGLLPPCWLAELPAPTTLSCVARETAFLATTSAARYRAARDAQLIVLTGRELGALAIGAESGRASHEALTTWLARKLEDPSWRLDAATALGGVEADLPATRWPLARVAAHWGIQIIAVEVEDA